jgi:hypothetical protein
MKQEAKEAIEKGALGLLGTGATWTLQDVNAVIAALVGVATIAYISAQLFFLLRKWYILERRSWKSVMTTPGDLDDKS